MTGCIIGLVVLVVVVFGGLFVHCYRDSVGKINHGAGIGDW
jgi:hypothetical protein